MRSTAADPLLAPLRIESGPELAIWLNKAPHGAEAELVGPAVGQMVQTARNAERVGDCQVDRVLVGGLPRFRVVRIRRPVPPMSATS